ncbi:hypothetical protein AMV155 [Betaentomopoxvirus amoorei]|uniref:AMV155 n=1 Tax=Amsacta moorei entomopoxvirus TaxID=28321 RepID=Q9EMP4_AMEPV|nr:hypothetical protein AMV155 [Amsacta moorei entomopoxvirus]AAG02861.1 AMV155 [Amsacta moorei entomopoxvirus]
MLLYNNIGEFLILLLSNPSILDKSKSVNFNIYNSLNIIFLLLYFIINFSLFTLGKTNILLGFISL